MQREITLLLAFMSVSLIAAQQPQAALPTTHVPTSIEGLTLTAVVPRLITPNGDGYNDKVRFEFDNPEGLPIKGRIFDVSGAEVSDLTEGTDPLSLLLWDGKDRTGRRVPAGVFIYQVEYKGKYITGTVGVAR